MIKKELLYEGKGKKLYKTDDDNLVIAEFKDDLTAFNAQKKSNESGKGALNCKISTQIFELLEKNNIPTHFVKMLDNENILCKKLDMIKIEVVVRNIATGSLCKRLGVQEGVVIKDSALGVPLIEFYYKDDSLNDPILNDSHCILMNLATKNELDSLKSSALKVNDILIDYFNRASLNLIDFKLEFGRGINNKIGINNEIMLADEISPDNCRLWDKTDNKKMDKDIFRLGLGSVSVAYNEVLNRLLALDN